MSKRKAEYVNPNTCARCPYRNSELGCPAWIGAEDQFIETNDVTGEMRAVTGCFYHVIPKLMVHVVKAANRSNDTFQDWRNDMARGLTQVANAVGAVLSEKISGLLPKGPETKQIEDKKDGEE